MDGEAMRVRTLLSVVAVTSVMVGVGATPASAIVGGSPAPTVAYMVQVFDERSAEGDVFQCGGTLVAKSWVLTARHCLADEGETTVVRVGSTELGSGTRIAVDRAETPPSAGDVALLHLVEEVDAAPVRLAAADPRFVAVGTMYGWGAEGAPADGQKPVMSTVLKQATTDVYSSAYPDGAGGPGLSSWSLGSTGGAYRGDSGGPLLVDGVQVGVISRINGNATASAFNDHASVARHRAWIRSVAGI
jgi:secreted trypsin-like serine protease